MPTYDIVSLAVVKAWLGISVTTYDDLLGALIDRLTAVMEREFHWYFGPARERVEIMCGTGTRKMFLSWPFYDGESGSTDFLLECRSTVGEAWETFAAADYEQTGRRLVRADNVDWTKGVDNFRATYDEGYDTVPGEVQQLALEAISATWKRRGSEGVQSETIGDYSYTLDSDMRASPSYEGVRGSYMRLRIGGC